MIRRFCARLLLPIMALTIAACGQAASTTSRAPSDGRLPASGESAGGPSRMLVAAVRVEPLTLASRSLREQGVAVYLSSRMFNAELANLDAEGNPRPYLLEAFPKLDTDTWKVFPDGKMETTYRLRPNLFWHDGTPMTAQDFVFSWRLYSTPELGAVSLPMNIMDDVQAVDDRTVVVKWRQPYPDAETLTTRNAGFPAMPKHVLESAYEAGQWDSFVNHSFWTTEYVGLGPYKLDRWEPGGFIEASAFDKHVSVKAKIERIRVLFIGNANTALANFLAGEAHLSADTALRATQVSILKREWGPDGGTAIFHPNQWRAALFQLRPELATPPALIDPRVRKALAHAVDKEPINGAVYEESSLVADTMIPPLTELGKAIDRAIVKYPYDLRRAEQLMAEAGFQKGADGVYAGATGRLKGEVTTNAATDNEAELAILARDWRTAGFDIQEVVVPAGMERDAQLRASFPGMWVQNTSVGEAALLNHTTSRIPTPQNRYQGGNRGGWSNADFDRLADMYSTELDRSKRNQLLIDMTKIQADDLPAISIFYVTQPWVFVSRLKGPRLVAPEANMSWDIETWEFR